MEKAALELLEMGPKAVVVKGGHLNGNCDDCLALKNTTVESIGSQAQEFKRKILMEQDVRFQQR